MATIDKITELIKTGLNDQLVHLLTQHPILAEGKTEHGISYLLFAAYCRNATAVELIKSRKSHLDIFEASAVGDDHTLKALISMQPDLVNEFSEDGFTPLGLACFFNQAESVRILLNHGADVNKPSKNDSKVAPIHSACAVSNIEIVKLLLDHGADVNVRQTNGITPLHAAAHNGQTTLIELLIQAGADVNARMDDGQTPAFMAEDKSFTESAALIKKYGGH